VTMLDLEAPQITCPTDRTSNTLPGRNVSAVSWDDDILRADNSVGLVRFTPTIPPGSLFPIGRTVVRYIARDAAGNQASCAFTVTVIDNENPRLSCPADVTTTTEPGRNTGRAAFPPALFTEPSQPRTRPGTSTRAPSV
jgi:hypothetical protein